MFPRLQSALAQHLAHRGHGLGMQRRVARKHQPPVPRQIPPGAKVHVPAVQIRHAPAQLPEHEVRAGVVPDARRAGGPGQAHEQVAAAENQGRVAH
ncbi:hypothetical protein E4U53_003051, partial [Claviceps sorghi]